MIVYPNNWNEIGKPIETKDIELCIKQILNQLSCNCLAFSGGLDSSLMLYFMLRRFEKVQAFTIGNSEDHPDVKYSKLVVNNFEVDRITHNNFEVGRTTHRIYIPIQKEINEEKDQNRDFEGDKAQRLFYKFVSKYTDEIISCDGIDEFMCGYYGHQVPQTEQAYYEYIRRLRFEQLEPLNRNSMEVNVYLPYLDFGLLSLLSQIPTYEKVNKEQRKIPMIEMARGKIPDKVIERWKYGFCDALKIKKAKNEN